jgi:hypothetical protein
MIGAMPHTPLLYVIDHLIQFSAHVNLRLIAEQSAGHFCPTFRKIDLLCAFARIGCVERKIEQFRDLLDRWAIVVISSRPIFATPPTIEFLNSIFFKVLMTSETRLKHLI